MEKKCPPLGTGSVDVSALQKAISKGDAAKVVESARTRVEPPKKEAKPEPSKPAAEPNT